MSTVEGVLCVSSLLVRFDAICYYCLSNNSRTVRLISPAPEQRKIRRKFRRIFCTCCELVLGMGEHSFPKVFPYFFPLAVFTLRAIWYIRYILKTDLNLMIPDVVIWQLMDFLQQIRIPHPTFQESWGFFFHSPLLKFGFFQIFKGGFLVSLRFSLTR